MVRQIVLAGLVVLVPAGLRAQGRGAMAPVSHVGAMAPRAVMSAPHPVPVRAMPGPRMVARGGTVRSRTGTPVARNARGQVTTRRRFENRFDNEDIARRRDCNSVSMRCIKPRYADQAQGLGGVALRDLLSFRFLMAVFSCRVLPLP